MSLNPTTCLINCMKVTHNCDWLIQLSDSWLVNQITAKPKAATLLEIVIGIKKVS